jgi:hypothetical protein
MAITSKSETTTASLVAGWLTSEEFSILEAVCETLLPSLEPLHVSSEVVAAYYRRSAHYLNVAQLLAETLALENAEEQAKFHQLLGLLAGPLGGLMLIRSPRAFKSLPQEKREKYLTTMANWRWLAKASSCWKRAVITTKGTLLSKKRKPLPNCI